MKVKIFAGTDILYASYHIAAIAAVAGWQNISFTTKGFPAFPIRTLALLVEQNGRNKKVIIDFYDEDGIYHNLLEWCDVYCKVNLNPAAVPANAGNKVVAAGPHFAIRMWPLHKTLWYMAANFLRCINQLPSTAKKREFIANYIRQHRRPALKDYTPQPSEKGYIFFASTLWKKEKKTNDYRANFIRACRQATGLHFEGGFVPRVNNDLPGYEAETVAQSFSPAEYMVKLHRSAAAFNTPAVDGCHGWKLGEFVAMGKAVISTPLSRELSVPMEHGVHMHLTDGSQEEIAAAVEKILHEPGYREKLEAGMRSYFQQTIAPQPFVELMLRAGNTDLTAP